MTIEGFYVTVMDRPHSGGPVPAGTRTGLLLGPYSTRPDAEHDVPTGERLAARVDDKAVWYAYGVTRVAVPDGKRLPRGRLNELAAEGGTRGECTPLVPRSVPGCRREGPATAGPSSWTTLSHLVKLGHNGVMPAAAERGTRARTAWPSPAKALATPSRHLPTSERQERSCHLPPPSRATSPSTPVAATCTLLPARARHAAPRCSRPVRRSPG